MNGDPPRKRILWPYAVIIIVICCCCLCCWYCCFWRCCVENCEHDTTVFLIRHAEKELDTGDVALAQEGEERAEELVNVLGQAGISAIYSTETMRTQMTAEPIATHLGLDVLPYVDPVALAGEIRSDHAGNVILVVGHSNTVPQTLEALGTDLIPYLAGYDNLFMVTLGESGDVRLVKAEYWTDG